MNVVDFIVLLLLIMSLVRGYQIGVVRQLGSTLGFATGVLLSVPIGTWLSGYARDDTLQTLITTSILLLLSFGLMTVGEYMGMRLKLVILKGRILNRFDNTLGIMLGGLTLLLGLWVGIALTALLPTNDLQRTIRASATFNLIDQHLPPASQLLSTLNHLININDTPLIFSGREPSSEANTTLPSLSNYDSIIAEASPSVVRIQGLGCGGIASGSGFIYAHNRVVTNAHVVAGVNNPKVYDTDGTHDATVIAFDSAYDIAVLAVDGLIGTPLTLEPAPVENGTIVLSIGFPGGGKQTPQVGAVLDTVNAVGRDIYLRQKTERNIYVLQASLIPGDSGGPVLDEQGRVTGIVFGTSTTYNNIGYALTLPQIMPILTVSRTAQTAVDTGACSKI